MSETPSWLRPRFPMSMVNRLGDPWREQIARTDLDLAKRAAERVTGLNDYGDTGGFGRRLDESVASLSKIDWNLGGRFAVRTAMRWHLINRLNLVECLKRHPEVQDIKIERPIFIVGFFRTGTTFVHNVLAADPDSRVGSTWEFCYPVGRKHDFLGDIRWRRRRTAIPLRMTHALIPDQDEVHDVTIDAFEEDFFLLENDMAVMKFVAGFGAFDYAWRMLEWDLEEPYRWHRLQLQILSAQRNAKRWLLKCPWHMWNLDALLKAYPDARIVHMHRNIESTIGSQCSLSARICCRLQRSVNVHEVGRFWVDYSLAGLERALAARDRLPASQVYDVRLRDVRTAPGKTLLDMYQHFDMPFDDALIDRFRDIALEEPTFQQGVHDYALEDFGLDGDSVRREFASYRARFGVD